ncbi:DUF5666 domain-containing protein [Thermus tengchongensis]|uniref:DUF5666 domain-containing protein n=1 Tax=Thermus tengchongensis TaxID=1214928 RepID=UPI001F1B1322|nr:DUF5666 domain-containing protein [Thermus tengchongensis]
MSRKPAIFWSGLVLLAACQLAPQSGEGFQALGVLGGTPERPTLMGKVLDTAGANLTWATLTTTPSTQFEARDQHLTREDFFTLLREGDRVEVKGTLSGTTIQASKVELKGR